jgi:uncharacterized membrane protein
MQAKQIPMQEAVSFGWQAMKRQLGFFIALLIALFIIGAFQEILSKSAEKAPLLPNIIVTLVYWLINIFLGLGVTKLTLKLSNNEKAEFGDFFSALPFFFRYLGASILYGLIVLGGLLLLLVPGIIWAIKFSQFGYLVIDKNLGPLQALKKSAEITAGVKGDLVLFGLLIFALNLAGFLCLFVGLFATIPTSWAAAGYVYRNLLAQSENSPT